MVISSVIGSGFHHILTSALPASSSSSAAFPAPLSSTKLRAIQNSEFTNSLTTAPSKLDDHSVPTRSSPNLPSIFHRTGQSAILEIQESSELESALSRSGGILRAQDFNVILRHFGKQNRWKELSQIKIGNVAVLQINFMMAKGSSRSPHKLLKLDRELAFGIQLFDWMRQNEKTNIASYSSYIKFIGKTLNLTKVLNIYNSIKDDTTRNNVSVCNSVLSCMVRSGKFESSLKLFHQMKRDGLKPDIVTYSTLLVGCAKVKDGYSKALELVKELKFNGLPMDRIIYGTLISVCASNKKCKEAERYFEEMKSEGHSPNVFHYGSLLNAYSADGNCKKAEELIHEMKCAGLELNKVTLTTLLKVYVRGGLFEKSRVLLSELEAAGYAADEMPYCILLDGLVKAGQVLEAKSVFDEMMNKEVKTDGYSHSIMICALCRIGLLQEAKQLISNYEAKYQKYDVVILNSMLIAHCRAGEMENVMKLMKKMDESAICPDWNTFHILIKYFCKEKLYVLAYRTMEDMHKKGYTVEEELCSSLMFHLGKTGGYREAFSVYNMLKYSKRNMCRSIHEKILHILVKGRLLKDAYVVVKDNMGLISQPAIRKFATSFMKSGNLNMVNDVIKAIHRSGLKIDQELFHIAMSRYLKEIEKKELLLQLLQWMPGQGYVVDSSTRDLILKNSHLFGRQTIAAVLSKHNMVSKAMRYHQKSKKR